MHTFVMTTDIDEFSYRGRKSHMNLKKNNKKPTKKTSAFSQKYPYIELLSGSCSFLLRKFFVHLFFSIFLMLFFFKLRSFLFVYFFEYFLLSFFFD